MGGGGHQRYFSDHNLAALPPKEVRALISRLQALVPFQGPAPSVLQMPPNQPILDKSVMW